MKTFEKVSDKKTSIRGVKVRGCYDSYDQAERRAKALQRTDRSFHVFVGQVGYWLPWDPNADQVQDEEYLEGELNTLMQEYKKNEINRDIFYEDQKREKLKEAARELKESKDNSLKKMWNLYGLEKEIEAIRESSGMYFETPESIFGTDLTELEKRKIDRRS